MKKSLKLITSFVLCLTLLFAAIVPASAITILTPDEALAKAEKIAPNAVEEDFNLDIEEGIKQECYVYNVTCNGVAYVIYVPYDGGDATMQSYEIKDFSFKTILEIFNIIMYKLSQLFK